MYLISCNASNYLASFFWNKTCSHFARYAWYQYESCRRRSPYFAETVMLKEFPEEVHFFVYCTYVSNYQGERLELELYNEEMIYVSRTTISHLSTISLLRTHLRLVFQLPAKVRILIWNLKTAEQMPKRYNRSLVQRQFSVGPFAVDYRRSRRRVDDAYSRGI